MRRNVAIRGLGAVGPFGSDVAAFEAWWRGGRPSLIGPIETLREAWLPTEQGCEVPAWRARSHVPDRKSIKLMTRCVQFGVAAALEAWGPTDDGAAPPPELRGMYTGCGVPADEDWTFRDAVNASVVDESFSMPAFGGAGQDLLNPLWLVKSLTNNVLAFTAKTLDLQGANDNFEAGAAGPLLALGSASDAVAEGRLQRALAGGSDSLVTVEALLGLARHGAFDGDAPLIPSQGGAFVRLEPGHRGDFGILGFRSGYAPLRPGPTPPPGPFPTADVEEALARTSESAWRQARAEGVAARRGIALRGPRLPDGPGDIDLWGALGDPEAAAGALLLAAAWALHRFDEVDQPIELQAAGSGGEVVTVILGILS